jgi:translation initiation factor IF-2
MAGIIVKIAKEFNVGVATVVDFLLSKGYNIENKPNAKVDDAMYETLQKEYKGSAAIKEKADLIQIGTVYKKPEEKLPPTPPPPPPPAPKVEIPEPVVEPAIVEAPIQEPAIIESVKEDDVIRAKAEPTGLKILGKIDLTKKVGKKKKSEPKEEAPKVEEIPTEEKEVAQVSEPSQELIAAKEDAPLVEEVVADSDIEFRAKTPQLAGLKILGKIDTKKFEAPTKKTKEDVKPVASKPLGLIKRGEGGSDINKTKRKRKKVQAAATSSGGAAPSTDGVARPRLVAKKSLNKANKDEVKEVSQKEIDDKIKATMARLNTGGKNKRQKIRRDNRDVKREKQELLDSEAEDTKLMLTEFISVSELASVMDVGVGEVITTCINLGVIVSINQRLDAEIIELVAGEYGFDVEFVNAEEVEDVADFESDDPADLEDRAPIVTVMGHVDHGKTSLLDYIRSANVASGEAGGITQHIGAYEVEMGEDKRKITFLDTPGHEAFTAMRARGAKVTDVAVIIIASDDHIMPQTKEAISHAQAAGVPIVFAINKIDKDGSDPTRIKQELSGMNLLVEEWGGTYQSQDISAKSGLNIDLLLEKILLEADVLELKANPKRTAFGTVIEASLDKGRGYVTKVLVQNGTLNIGDPIVAGGHSGKIKAMFNEKGKKVKSAGPSAPVLILGLSGAPQAGEKFRETENEQEARQIAAKRAQIEREQTNRASKRISLDEIGRRLALGTFKELNLIVKGDVDGSIEALADSLIKLSVEKIQVNVIHKAVGQIVESDVLLASASDAIIIGFQVRPSTNARVLAEKEGVQIKSYSIIYEAIEEVKMAMEGMLEPTKEEKILGQVEVREIYKISKLGTIAGSYVTEGKIMRNNHVRIIRDGIVVFPTKEGAHGEISSLKRFKDDMKEVKNGMECGVSIKNYNDIREGDIIEAYEIIEIKTKLE